METLKLRIESTLFFVFFVYQNFYVPTVLGAGQTGLRRLLLLLDY